ncbi:hypothetical protein ACX0HA_08860 [Flavobacterium hauense]
MDPFKELTDLQLQYGYKLGELNPVALLGLFGEAGEVLNEVIFYDLDGDENEKRKALAVGIASIIDDLKKYFRANPHFAPGVMIVREDEDGGEAFDKEVADTLYYLNLIALNRGRDLAYYAQLSVDKVKAKGLKPPKTEQQDTGEENV